MMPGRRCTSSVEGDKVTVDGRVYPMASSIVATEDVIQASIRAAAQKIAEAYRPLTHRNTHPTPGAAPDAAAVNPHEAPISLENPLILISVLKGSYIFTADLVRYLGDAGLPHVVDFVRLASYNSGTTSTGTISVMLKPKFTNLQGKHVLIVEDVCDSGRTLKFLRERLIKKYQPKSVKTIVMVNKDSSARKVDFEPEFECLKAPNAYIVGYGFEVNDRYRDVRHIFTLKDGFATRYPAKL
ncbi:xanthine phosphoribosyltransferase (XRPT) [Leptomonas pyrrhocoris]|uniref:Xanthine phosphoribosyltransferase (XRPT) n=1 Tax=Leptomonas pyrrhocoris TaxID=157538 RepID=A0A0N0DU95_LEPPY|nr:xanthine phosphoribosyltransferase (XRPT) [Leptomonas pyrrhocoris]XP_015656670.1 xanthine phosphoribosyltransferase (XRPT) [Leptomonas pyrrhocoris]KPA78230.1 xanthine phosphoribosyltransferase (XRPT) [Leptomonas pyrrhocoris]KPA78231.1 xanthine phosphoribosyltransferase (XRPT) [Leptomonas pyrrhocoris]|eukprot:XP_015656669.1 xanthine phosphoribosyltransferase (XRPT) [Leptomonas pyrrhocoris]